jgi:hypothetical protein
MNSTQAHEIASLFALPSPFEVSDFAEKGNINRQTYLVVAGPPQEPTEYILQLLNPVIFTQPRRVMEAMILCLEAQEKMAAEIRLNGREEWETIRLIPTRDGKPYLTLENGEEIQCWRMMARISNARSYKNLHQIADPAFRLKIAGQAGRGLALFSALTAGMDPAQISGSLPGYRDTGLYYNQLHSALAGNRTAAEASMYLPEDPVLRKATGPHFLIHLSDTEHERRQNDPRVRRAIELALEQKQFAMKLANGLATGELRRRIVHGDTKLENFLFAVNSGNVRALVDMDTIMPHTWLSDWGDTMRSLVNPAGERETDLTKVQIDLEVFRAAAHGFLSSAHNIALDEIALMADAIQIMALELGVRFLADYLRGDTYFMLGPSEPPDLNKTRALVQFCLFEELRNNNGRLNQILRNSEP